MTPSSVFAAKPLAVRVGIALGLVYVVWGSTYLAIRVTVQTLPPLMSGGVRFLVAGAILYFASIRTVAPAEKPTRTQWRSSAIIGALLLLGGNGMVVLAEAHGVKSGIAALLVGAVPLWMGAIGFLVYRERLRPLGVIGLAVGFIGVGILAKPSGSFPLAGTILMIGATLSWSIGSLHSKRANLPKNIMVTTGMQMLCGGAFMLIVGAAIGEVSRFHIRSVSLSSVLALLYLIFIGAIVGYTAYIYALSHGRTSLVSTYAYVNPVIAVLLGALILSEPITARALIGGAIILASVALTLTAKPHEVAKAPAERVPA